jgi:hypothetical protein
MTRLSRRHQQFVLEYITDFDATRAIKAIGTGSSQPAREAHVLLGRDDIQQALCEEMRTRMDGLDLAAEDLLEADMAIAFADIGDFAEWDHRGVRVRDSASIDPRMRRAVAAVEDTKHGVRLRMHGKHPSLERLGKRLQIVGEARGEVRPVETDQSRAKAAASWLREAQSRWDVGDSIQALIDCLEAEFYPAAVEATSAA